MDQRERARERKKARIFWNRLDRASRFELGDAFVLGTFDWRDWLDAKPSPVFLSEVDDLRLHWECDVEPGPARVELSEALQEAAIDSDADAESWHTDAEGRL